MTDLLVIDDEKLILWGLKRDLERSGYRVFAFQNGEEALPLLEKQIFNAALIDVRLPGIGGLEILAKLKQANPETQVIMITAFADVEMAVNSIRNGAFDFVLKPFTLTKIQLVVQNALEAVRLKKEVASLKTERALRKKKDLLQGDSPVMRRLLSNLEKIGKVGPGVILLCGESGTGKGIAANDIHQNGPRSDEPFIEINCGAIPENLFESELFGHEKGSFSGASDLKKGLLELADGGTIFLDEVSEMPMKLQTKFLKALEEQTIWRVGGCRPIKVDVNIIAASNRDLSKAVRDGAFREDLFYRLNVIPIFLPPLRDRGDDVLLLANHFLERFQNRYKRSFNGFSVQARDKMLSYSWPGNIRELKNSVERAVILEASETINEESLGLSQILIEPTVKTTTLLSEEPDIPESGLDLLGHLEAVEKKYLQKALNSCNGNQSQSAKILGMTRDVLRYRLKKYGIPEV